MKRRKMLQLLTALAVMSNQTLTACPKKSSDKSANTGATPDEQGNPPDPAQPPEKGSIRTVLITAFVEDEFCPYTVTVDAVDGTTGRRVDGFEEHVVSGPFSYVMAYTSGVRAKIMAEVKPARAGSRKGYLILKDGPMNKRTAKIDGAWRAQIDDFRTAR